jgi:hypothetical protein
MFRGHFDTCETFLLNIPQHGLYNFSYSDNPDNALTSVIVENGVDVRINSSYSLFSIHLIVYLLSYRIIVLFMMKTMHSNLIH